MRRRWCADRARLELAQRRSDRIERGRGRRCRGLLLSGFRRRGFGPHAVEPVTEPALTAVEGVAGVGGRSLWGPDCIMAAPRDRLPEHDSQLTARGGSQGARALTLSYT